MFGILLLLLVDDECFDIHGYDHDTDDDTDNDTDDDTNDDADDDTDDGGRGTCILPKFPAAAVNIFCANG